MVALSVDIIETTHAVTLRYSFVLAAPLSINDSIGIAHGDLAGSALLKLAGIVCGQHSNHDFVGEYNRTLPPFPILMLMSKMSFATRLSLDHIQAWSDHHDALSKS